MEKKSNLLPISWLTESSREIADDALHERLQRSSVHLWRIPLDCASSDCSAIKSTLSPAELERLEKFSFEKHKRRFLLRRAARRWILAKYTTVTPKKLVFDAHSNGKPYIKSDSRSVHFSATHSEDLALVCVSTSPVGIDLELSRPLNDLDRISKECMTPDEFSTFS